MAGIDDAELLELAAEQQSELFPTLKRGSALAPLIALLAILPSLYALTHNSLDAGDALWGLKSLDLLAAPDLEGILFSSSSVENHSACQPPLGSWLTALVLLIPGLSHAVGLAIVSFLSTAGIVAIWYLLCGRLAGPRFAFWATAMIACHGPLLMQVQSPAPTALAILLALCAFWGFFAHLQDAEGIASVKLLMAGIALGLCLLAGGLLAVAVLVADTLLVVVMGTGSARNGSYRHRSHGQGRWTALTSLGVLASIAVSVGGWWVLMMASQYEYGSEFWAVWFGFDQLSATANRTAVDVPETFVVTAALAHQLIDLMGTFFGLALYGLWRAACELWQRKNKSRRLSLKFLCVWLVCALPAWYASLSLRDESADLWRMFVLLPLVGFAAFAIEQVIERGTRPLVALWLFCLSILIPEWSAVFNLPASGETMGSIREAATVMTAWFATGFSLLSVWLVVFARHRDRRRRVCLTGALLLIVWVNASQGLQSIRLTADERQSRRTLREFHDSLLSTGPLDDQVLIIDSASPAVIENARILTFVMRSIRPDLDLKTVRNWNEGRLLIHDTRESSALKRTVLIVDWRTVDRISTRPPSGYMQWKRHSTPVIWHGRRLTTYLLTGSP